MNAKRDVEARAAWRAQVRAFRAAAAALDRPAPRAMSLLSEVAAVAKLAAEPPITNFSPFEALPPGDHAARAETSGGADARAPRHAEAARAVLDAQPSRAASARRGRPTHRPEASQGTGASPVFSLRPPRPRDSRTAAADDSTRERRESSFADARPSAPRAARAGGLEATRILVGPREVAGPVPPPPAPEASAGGGELSTLPRAEGAGRAAQHAQYPTALPLLDDLADEALRALRLREGDPRRAAGTPAAAPRARDRRRPDDLQTQSPATARHTGGLTTTPRASARVSEATASPGALAPARAPLKSDGGRTDGVAGNSIERINALAELLSPRTAAPASERVEATAESGAPPAVESLPSHEVEAPAPRAAASSPGLGAVGEVGQPASLDAESVASLVNDILVEQARRHGVDLS